MFRRRLRGGCAISFYLSCALPSGSGGHDARVVMVAVLIMRRQMLPETSILHPDRHLFVNFSVNKTVNMRLQGKFNEKRNSGHRKRREPIQERTILAGVNIA